MDSIVEFEAKQHAMEQKHSRARHAWRHLADNLSKDDIKKFLGVRWEDMYSYWAQLKELFMYRIFSNNVQGH